MFTVIVPGVSEDRKLKTNDQEYNKLHKVRANGSLLDLKIFLLLGQRCAFSHQICGLVFQLNYWLEIIMHGLVRREALPFILQMTCRRLNLVGKYAL